MNTANHAKFCRVCLEECSGGPRVREPDGQYVCRPCFDMEQATARPRRADQASDRRGASTVSASTGYPEGSATLEVPAPDEVGLITGRGACICTSCKTIVDRTDIVCATCGESLEGYWADPEAQTRRARGIFANRGIRHPIRWGVLAGISVGLAIWLMVDPDRAPLVAFSGLAAGGVGGAIVIVIITRVSMLFETVTAEQADG